jgi:predicted lipoprotein with Yx(FWY)xxD motif
VRKSLATLLVPLALVLAACGSSSSGSATSSGAASASSTASSATGTTSSTSSGAALATRSVPGLGVVLVTGQGQTLYTFAPDKHAKVTCTGSCAAVWPPLKVAAGQKAGTSGPVTAALVSSDSDPAGGRVVTYAGWPLYRYVGDPTAGTAHGQGLNSGGGLWWVITPAGKLITTKPSSSSSSSTSTSGGSGY